MASQENCRKQLSENAIPLEGKIPEAWHDLQHHSCATRQRRAVRSPDERSEIRGLTAPFVPHVATLMRAICLRLISPTSSALRGRAPTAVDLPAHERDRLLIDRGGIPSLDRREIGFAGLVPCARAPAVALEEVCRRGQCGVHIVEASAGAVIEDALG